MGELIYPTSGELNGILNYGELKQNSGGDGKFARSDLFAGITEQGQNRTISKDKID